jgi:hypothetical protein
VDAADGSNSILINFGGPGAAQVRTAPTSGFNSYWVKMCSKTSPGQYAAYNTYPDDGFANLSVLDPTRYVFDQYGIVLDQNGDPVTEPNPDYVGSASLLLWGFDSTDSLLYNGNAWGKISVFEDGRIEISPAMTEEPWYKASFNAGWDLISLYKQPADTDIGTVLAAISGKYISVWSYVNGSWKVYDPNNPGFSDLTTMEAGSGYWINMTEAANANIIGSVPTTSLSLKRGWNLVGYNSSTSQAVADALASIAGNYVSAWAYMDGNWKVYDPANPGFSDLTTMEPGYGYWINTTKACTWTLP